MSVIVHFHFSNISSSSHSGTVLYIMWARRALALILIILPGPLTVKRVNQAATVMDQGWVNLEGNVILAFTVEEEPTLL